ncbi:MAG: DUF4150 domain-containing protein [Deltaproteobacteria bacterium]|nr:DUF4150 domain-containing protein [Deltaproteobacteria bacterium]
MGMCNQARGDTVSMVVKICMKEAMTKKTEIPQSSGDEAGSAGGIISPLTTETMPTAPWVVSWIQVRQKS